MGKATKSKLLFDSEIQIKAFVTDGCPALLDHIQQMGIQCLLGSAVQLILAIQSLPLTFSHNLIACNLWHVLHSALSS